MLPNTVAMPRIPGLGDLQLGGIGVNQLASLAIEPVLDSCNIGLYLLGCEASEAHAFHCFQLASKLGLGLVQRRRAVVGA
jgi:hypothetical protein